MKNFLSKALKILIGLPIFLLIVLEFVINKCVGEVVLLVVLSILILCSLVIIFGLSFLQLKDYSNRNKIILETSLELIKQELISKNQLINDERELRNQKFKLILEIGKLKKKKDKLKNEIDVFYNNLKIKNQTDKKKKSIDEIIKRKQIELDENKIMLEEYEDHLKGITEALVEIKNEFNKDGDKLKKAD